MCFKASCPWSGFWAADFNDDFLAFSNDSRLLVDAREALDEFLRTLRLRLHRDKSVIFPVTQGIPFLGYRVFPTHLRLAKQNLKRFRRRMRRLQALYTADDISADELRQRIVSWIGHAGQADSFHLRERLLAEFPFRKGRDKDSKGERFKNAKQ